jgi:CheY-like chemotaxis protein
LRTLSNSGGVIDMIRDWDPDLILLDLHMPNVDGMTLLVHIRTHLAMPEIPIVVITADSTVAARTSALSAGASDFLLKPIDVVEVTLRVRNLLGIQRLHRQLTDHMALLEQRVEARTAELAASQRRSSSGSQEPVNTATTPPAVRLSGSGHYRYPSQRNLACPPARLNTSDSRPHCTTLARLPFPTGSFSSLDPSPPPNTTR